MSFSAEYSADGGSRLYLSSAEYLNLNDSDILPLPCVVIMRGNFTMCGIIGYTGSENAVPKLLDGLSALEYRGYDSAGVAVFDSENKIRVIKSKGRLSVLRDKIGPLSEELYSRCGIGHTRWATHGEPSDINSHPHGTLNVSIVHNGIIENYADIKEILIKKGYNFISETDTETAAKLIDSIYLETRNPVDAMLKAAKLLTGSFAVGAVFADYPGVIYAMRRESPLIVAVSDKGCFIASDISAVLKYTNRFYRIKENEIAIVNDREITVLGADKIPVNQEIETADWDIEAAEKGGYPFFMIKEIHEEPEAVIKTLRPRIKNGMPDLGIPELTDERLMSFERIHIVACGTAMHAGMVGKYVIEKLVRVPVNVEIASEFRYSNPILGKRELVIIISQSGETADTLAALRLAKQNGVYTLAVVNVPGSTISNEADSVIYTWAGPEIAVASTKAYEVQLAVMYLFAFKLAYVRGMLSEEDTKRYLDELLYKVPEKIEKSIALEKRCSEIAEKYKNHKNIFFIGRGADYILSMESALKLKEISYIHCEAYAAGELKHGTISLVTDGTPVFAIACQDGLFEKMVSNIGEVRARGASVILLCKESAELPDGIAEDIIRVPETSELFIPMPVITISQLIAYYTSLRLGLDVDKPRNLAKSVTVE